PEDDLKERVSYYWRLGMDDKAIVEHVLRHFDQEKFGLRIRDKLGLKGTRQRGATIEDIAPYVQDIRSRFPTMGARQMVNVLRQDHLIKVPESVHKIFYDQALFYKNFRSLLLSYFQESEPEAVRSRKKHRFRRKRFWAAGVMDILSIDQHDKWKRFGLWLHLACDPYPGRIAWLKIWWCNRNTRLLNNYYINAGRKVGGVPLVTQSDRGKENNGIANMHTALRHRLDPSLNDTLQHRWCIDKSNIKAEALWSQLRRQFTPGFENILDKGLNEGLYDPLDPLESLVFRWLAIPWLQAELDAWAERYNTTKRRQDKHKLLPHGIPNLIHDNPQDYGAKNFMVIVTPDLFDELEAQYAPPDDPVFLLAPQAFQEQAFALYNAMGSPGVSSVTFWDIYTQLLTAFRSADDTQALREALLTLNEGEEYETPLIAGLHDLRHGMNIAGPQGTYTYLGGLENPFEDDDDIDLLRGSNSFILSFHVMSSGTPSATSGYEAEFTPAETQQMPVICGRPQCLSPRLPPGTKLEFLHSVDPSQPGRAVCKVCYAYYKNKETTRRRLTIDCHAMSSQPLSLEVQDDIRRQIAKAQRGKETNTVQAIGTSSSSSSHQVVKTPNGPMQIAMQPRPTVILPGLNSPLRATQPTIHQSASIQAGYTQSHASYEVTKRKLASQAYAKHEARVVVCEVRLARKPIGNVKTVQVGDCIEAIDNVSLHIGANELKALLFNLILPTWTKYSGGFSIGINDVIMRNKDWVEIRPKDPDMDAISASFLKDGKKGESIFKPGRCLIYLHLPNDVYKLYEDWIEAQEFEGLLDRVEDTKAKGKEKRKAAEKTPASRKRALSPELTSADFTTRIDCTQPSQTMTRGSKRQKTNTISAVASDHLAIFPTQRLSDVLRMQRPPRDVDVQALFSSITTIHASARRIEEKTILQLLDMVPSSFDPNAAIAGRFDYQAYLGTAVNVVLQLDLSSKKQRTGGFKISSLGTASIPLFNSSDKTAICAKQTYYRKERTVTREDGNTTYVAQNIPHDGRTQAKELTVEIACLVWARALLHLVYRYIEAEIVTRGEPPFPIPQFRFVEAALAIEQVEAGKEAQVFLLEEVIGGTEGPFRKYLNNMSPIPLHLLNQQDEERGEFLAFTQHVQYFRTKKQIFVSDYQGGNTLLTDPQIVTDRLLGPIFADGNVPATHENFEANHRCNKYCDFFEVPVDYDLWES
ncbi:hypothetical protein H0H92_005087, partial [Tricholoma furcatifolium]